MHHIVCYDPKNVVRPGSIVENLAVASLRAKEVVLLPIDTEDYFAGPAQGFSLRLLGLDGWRYTGNRPERGCHLPLGVREGDHTLEWCARFMPIDENLPMSGSFKLLADTSGGALSGAVRAVDRVDQLPVRDRYSGVTVYGKCALSTSIQGMLTLLLHGVASNVRCVAFAVSAT